MCRCLDDVIALITMYCAGWVAVAFARDPQRMAPSDAILGFQDGSGMPTVSQGTSVWAGQRDSGILLRVVDAVGSDLLFRQQHAHGESGE